MRPVTVREEYVRARAKLFIREHGIIQPPTDLEKIVKKLKILVEYCLDPDLSCPLLFKKREQYYVIMPISPTKEMHQWILAKEIGHIVLGHCDIYRADTLDEDVLTPSERAILEREADIFAEEILMPSEWFSEYENLNTKELVKLLQVPAVNLIKRRQGVL